MSARELLPQAQVTPASVASDLLSAIQAIEALVSGTQDEIKAIEGRGWWARLRASSQDDMVKLSNSQNAINAMMLELINEVITLNTASYAFLAAVIGELEERARNGWKDAEGNFQELSQTGKDFAEKARNIFLRIAEGSRDTQRRIETNERMVSDLQLELSHREQADARQDQALEQLSAAVADGTRRFGALEAGLQLAAGRSAAQEQELGHVRAMLEAAIQRNAEAAESQARAMEALRTRQREHEVAFGALDSEVRAMRARLAYAEDLAAASVDRLRRRTWALASGAGVAALVAAAGLWRTF